MSFAKLLVRKCATLTFVIFFLTLPAIAIANESIPDRAQADQIWGRTYVALVEQLGDVWLSGVNDDFSKTAGIDPAGTALIRRYLTSYPADDFRVDWVLLRYPHYNPVAIQSDLERLADLDLIAEHHNGSWALTGKGSEKVAAWHTIINARAAKYETHTANFSSDVLFILNKITHAAATLDDENINNSINWRLNHEIRIGDSAPSLARMDERIWDYVAFINDNAHYRLDRYARQIDDDGFLLPSALAKELFAAMRAGRVYPLSRCANHPVWRNGDAACRAAMQELVDLNWVQALRADNFSHTDNGDALFRKVEAFTDKRLYQTWSNVNEEEYTLYKKILDSMKARAEELNNLHSEQ